MANQVGKDIHGGGIMKSYFRTVITAVFSVTLTLFPRGSFAQDQGMVARWSFDEATRPFTRDSVSGVLDKIVGLYKYEPGVSGTGLHFDGYTTSILRSAAYAPKLRDVFSVAAWVALNTYPWSWVPVIDQEEYRQVGYFFGIDAFGHISLQMAIDGRWRSVTSTAQLPLKKWAHIVGTFDGAHGLALYLDGKRVGELAVQGSITPAEGADILIGRVRQALLPAPSEAIHPINPVWYSFDGIMDEVEIYDRSLAPEEIERIYVATTAPKGEVLPWPALPSGPPGAGHFGAYYYSLKYLDTWDSLRRIGPESDVVVRFDQSPIRLVFWQGTNYIPAWVTENGKWYTDEFLETGGPGCPDGADCEPISDKQSRYSHVRILESNDVRAVVHWRYALSEVENYKGAYPDPLTGWFDWADEYWTVYPDGVAVRKQVLWTSDLAIPHEWQETIIVNAPGTRPEDNINLDALKIGNMRGEIATYAWSLKAPESFERPNGPQSVDKPQDPNIQLVNLKSTWKPFQIVPPLDSRFTIYGGEKTYFTFECWNHWPVAQIASSDRPCIAPDRASHTSLSHIYWQAKRTSEHTMTKLLLNGLTTKSIGDLIPLAKSWLSPPKIEVEAEGFQSEGYDPTQRAFVVARKNAGRPVVTLTLQASEASPVLNPAIVIKNWGDEAAQLKINGKAVAWGKDFRHGYVHRLDRTDLVVWIRQEWVAPLRIVLAPEG